MTKTVFNVGSPMRLAEKILGFFTKKDLRNGFFIEAGANNGLWQSNTYYLEEILGWNGLLVEPNPTSFQQCQIHRSSSNNLLIHSALVDLEYEKEYIEGYFSETDYENTLMAQVGDAAILDHQKKRWGEKELLKVPATSLSNILDENNIEKIDFFSLDVEGYELKVLNGINIKKHRPTYVCVEVWDNYPTRDEVLDFFPKNGYNLVEKMTKQDYLFVDTEKSSA